MFIDILTFINYIGFKLKYKDMVNKDTNSIEDEKKGSFKNSQFFKCTVFTLLALCLFAIDFVYYQVNRDNSLSRAMEESKAVLLDMTTNKVIAGKLYAVPEEKKTPLDATPLNIQDEDRQDKKGIITEAPKTIDKQQNGEELQTQLPIMQIKNKPKAKVALIVTELGLDRQLTLNVLEMPTNITLGFTPYSANVEEWINYAVSKGFETLINIPMHPNNLASKPGAHALLNNLSVEENLGKLDHILSKAGRVVGIYSNPHESFTKFASNMVPVFSQLSKKKLYFIYGNLNNAQNIKSLSDYYKVNLVTVNARIDEELTVERIKNNLLKLEEIADNNGFAIGFMSAYNITLDEVKEWMKNIDAERFAVVPISQLFVDDQVGVQNIQDTYGKNNIQQN